MESCADSTFSAVALYRDESKLHSFRGTQASKSSIDLYSCAGKLIRRLNWDKGSIKGLGWSDDEKLIVVTADGTVRCYYDLQGDFEQFSLGNGSDEYGVEACRYLNFKLLGVHLLMVISDSTETVSWHCFRTTT